MGESRAGSPQALLTPPQLHAARCVVAGVRSQVNAQLVQASLFGSRARGDARPDSDVDLLLVFRWLPDDREPYATQAEAIAARQARRLRVPVTVWSVSLIDLAQGNRTPMLVDALEDAVPLWCNGAPLPAVPFTPHDGLTCVSALLRRVEEGSDELSERLWRGEDLAAAARLRDDLVRVCTAALLLEGVTRPRRGDVARAFLDHVGAPFELRPVFHWAERSFGSDGTDEEATVLPPPGGFERAAEVVERLRRMVEQRAEGLQRRLQDLSL